MRLEKQSILSPIIKINSKWIKDLDVKPKTIKLLEESIGIMFQDTGIDKEFWGKAPKIKEIKAKETNGITLN